MGLMWPCCQCEPGFDGCEPCTVDTQGEDLEWYINWTTGTPDEECADASAVGDCESTSSFSAWDCADLPSSTNRHALSKATCLYTDGITPIVSATQGGCPGPDCGNWDIVQCFDFVGGSVKFRVEFTENGDVLDYEIKFVIWVTKRIGISSCDKVSGFHYWLREYEWTGSLEMPWDCADLSLTLDVADAVETDLHTGTGTFDEVVLCVPSELVIQTVAA